MRKIAVVTVGRSDFGIYRPVLKAIEAAPDLELALIAGGAHLAPEFGDTINEIRAEGFSVAESVDLLLAGDTPPAIAKSMGLGMIGFSQTYARLAPDLLLVLGDRFEMLAAAAAAVPFNIPIAHIHGGEVTEGAIDDAFRHAITKFSHLHFVATEEYGRRVQQLGESPWRVTVSGAPSLDNLHTLELLGQEEIEKRVGMSFDSPPLLVTFHPATREFEQTQNQIRELLLALENWSGPMVFTKPNADTNGRVIIERLAEFCAAREQAVLCDNLGSQAYFSLMRIGAAMVGNSSSGIIEAASFDLPVVNIGSRQAGRTRSGNVIDVDNGSEAIAAGLKRAASPAFLASIQGRANAYGDGCAAPRIVERLANEPLDDRLLKKQFYDLRAECNAREGAA